MLSLKESRMQTASKPEDAIRGAPCFFLDIDVSCGDGPRSILQLSRRDRLCSKGELGASLQPLARDYRMPQHADVQASPRPASLRPASWPTDWSSKRAKHLLLASERHVKLYEV